MIATAWLLWALGLCLFVWLFANRRISVFILPIVIAASAASMYVPTGTPRSSKIPKGNYVIVGADIIKDVSIGLLLKTGKEPATYYVLPYSNNKASEVQRAVDDGNAGAGAPHLSVGDDGEGTVVAPPPPPPKPAPAIAPTYSGG